MTSNLTLSRPDLPLGVQSYLNGIAQKCKHNNYEVNSIILFGSAAKGGFSKQISDLDLFIVFEEELIKEQRNQITTDISNLEIKHGFKEFAKPRNFVQNYLEGGNDRSFFICSRKDLLSGNIARIFNLNAVETFFIDRIVLVNIIRSALVVYGEDLLPQIPLPSVRRLDVFKSLFYFTNYILMTLVAYIFLPNATRYAMGTLKRSIHSCYFCYNKSTSTLQKEIAFFQKQLGESATLKQLLELRNTYHNSFKFVLACLPVLVRLHFKTALQNNFPFEVG